MKLYIIDIQKHMKQMKEKNDHAENRKQYIFVLVLWNNEKPVIVLQQMHCVIDNKLFVFPCKIDLQQ